MTTRRHILLTGATGQVGGVVLGELVERGARVTCLARAQGGRSAADRIRDTLLRVGRSPGLPFDVVEGELTAPRLGLDDMRWRRLAGGVDRIIHSAARVAFEADESGEPYRTNVDGTREVIRLARAAGNAPLLQVSTAYVCGGGEAPVAEAVSDEAPRSRNDYERSKWLAEREVWAAGQAGLPVAIARPSIIVGAAGDGRAVHFQGFYLVCRAVSMLCRRLRHDRQGSEALALDDFDLPGDLTGPLNLVPADYVGAAVAVLGLSDAACGGVYHLTHPRPPSLGQVYEALADYFRVSLPRVDARRRRMPSGALRRVAGQAARFAGATRVLWPYFGLSLDFETARARALLEPFGVRPASMDRGLIERVIDYAEATGYGRRLPLAP
ncbi:MAG: SDR family oxidoreductase [bacterium]